MSEEVLSGALTAIHSKSLIAAAFQDTRASSGQIHGSKSDSAASIRNFSNIDILRAHPFSRVSVSVGVSVAPGSSQSTICLFRLPNSRRNFATFPDVFFVLF